MPFVAARLRSSARRSRSDIGAAPREPPLPVACVRRGLPDELSVPAVPPVALVVAPGAGGRRADGAAVSEVEADGEGALAAAPAPVAVEPVPPGGARPPLVTPEAAPPVAGAPAAGAAVPAPPEAAPPPEDAPEEACAQPSPGTAASDRRTEPRTTRRMTPSFDQQANA
jgi:hypothetical protein